MKIAVTSTGPTLEDNVDVECGRHAYLLIADGRFAPYEALTNPAGARCGV